MVPCDQHSLDEQASWDWIQTPAECPSRNAAAAGGSLPVDVPLSSLALHLGSYRDSLQSAAHGASALGSRVRFHICWQPSSRDKFNF